MEIKINSKEDLSTFIRCFNDYLNYRKELYFLDDNKDIYEIGVISHPKKEAIDAILDDFKVNSLNRIVYIYHEDEAFIGIRKEVDDLVLVTNMEYLSPKLLIRSLIMILSSIYDSSYDEDKLFISNFNVKVLTNTENKRDYFKNNFLKVEYLEEEKCFYYRQMFESLELKDFISCLIKFNFELALPVVLMGGKKDGDEFLTVSHDNFEKLIEHESMDCQNLLRIVAIIRGNYFVPRVVGDKMAHHCCSMYIPHLILYGRSLRNDAEFNYYYEREERNILESKEIKEYFDLIKSKNKNRQEDVKNIRLK